MNIFQASITHTIPAAGNVEVTISDTLNLMSVVMTLAASVSNAFSVTLTRGGVVHTLYAPVASIYSSIVWGPDNGVVLKPKDVLTFANTAAQVGQVFFSYEVWGPGAPSITVTPGPQVEAAMGPIA